MSLFSSAFSRLFGRFTPYFRQRETQQYAVQELAAVDKLPEIEDLNFSANYNKSFKKHKRLKKLEKGKHLQTLACPADLKLTKGKQPNLPGNCGDFSFPGAHLQPLPPLKRQSVHLVKEQQGAPDELFSFRFSSVRPQSPITEEECQHDFVLPGCPLEVSPLKVLTIPPPCSVPAQDEGAPDELFSFRFSLVCPQSPITEEEPQLDFVLPGCPLEVTPLKVLTIPPLCSVPAQDECASDELFSCQSSSVCSQSPITEEEPQHDFVLPGCPLEVPTSKVPPVPLPSPVPAQDECASDELFSCQSFSACPLSFITKEEPQHEFVLPGCPLQVPPPKLLAVPLPHPVAAPDELFSHRFSSPLRTFTEEEPQHDFVLPGCLLELPPMKVLTFPPPSPDPASDLQDLSESGDSLSCITPTDCAEDQLKFTVQKKLKNRVQSQFDQLSWAEKVRQWVKRKLQKQEKMRERAAELSYQNVHQTDYSVINSPDVYHYPSLKYPPHPLSTVQSYL